MKSVLLFIFCISLASCLRFGSWNIQIFGDTKSSRPAVMDVLAKSIIQWDLFFMQELKNSPTGECGNNTGPAICSLQQKINSLSTEKYEVIVSDRVGSGSGIEQYTLFYKPSVVKILRYEIFVDKSNLFFRPPALAYLQIGTTNFWVINIHTNPDNATTEIGNLPLVVDFCNKTDSDILILGDFNSDSPYFSEVSSWPIVLAKLSGAWTNMIPDVQDTTVSASSKTYDRFLISPTLLPSFISATAKPFPFNDPANGGFSMTPILTEGCSLAYLACNATNLDASLKVSDHFPIQVTANFASTNTDTNPVNTPKPTSSVTAGGMKIGGSIYSTLLLLVVVVFMLY